MKKTTAMVLAAVMICVIILSDMSAAFAANINDGYATGSVSVNATKFHAAPAMDNGSISAAVWGAPTISINAGARNAYLNDQTGTNALAGLGYDAYFRWDESYLYIGVVTNDPDIITPSSEGAPWKGDAIQFIIDPDGANKDPQKPASPFSANARNISFGRDPDGRNVVRDHTAGRTMTEAWTSYHVDATNTITLVIAVPHSYLGLSADDIRAGHTYGLSLARVNANEYKTYNGFVVWGAGVLDNDTGRQGNNAVVLCAEYATGSVSVNATKFHAAPDMNNGPISAAVWGTPTISINAGARNAYLNDQTGTNALAGLGYDAYFRWDESYLYIGVVTNDPDVITPVREKEPWKGDAIQFIIDPDGANKNPQNPASPFSANARNISFGQDPDRRNVVRDHTAGRTMTEAWTSYHVDATNTITLVIAVPHSYLGLSADDIRAGHTYGLSLARVNANEYKTYNGFVVWGAGVLDNDTGRQGNNAVVLSAEYATGSVSVNATKFHAAPDMNNGPISAAVWGAPTISINAGARNAYLNDQTGTNTLAGLGYDAYFRWDESYLYIGVVTNDPDIITPSSEGAPWKGDAIQFIIDPDGANKNPQNPASPFSANARNISFGQDPDRRNVVRDHTASRTMTEAWTSYHVDATTNTITLVIAVPHSYLGLSADDIRAGHTYGLSLARISASAYDSYNGWVVWGAGVLDNDTSRQGNNAVVLCDGAGVLDGDAPAIERLINISDAQHANRLGNAADVSTTSRLVNTPTGTYGVFVNRSAIVPYSSTMNAFSLIKLHGSTGVNLASGYTVLGNLDILADQHGNVYLVGGASTGVLDRSANQKAILSLWTYNEQTGVLQGYETMGYTLPGVADYKYETAIVNNQEGAIYAFYSNGQILAWARFDLYDKKWSAPVIASEELIMATDSVYSFATGTGFTLVYQKDGAVYTAVCSDMASGNMIQTAVAGGELLDAYIDVSGALHLLYMQESQLMYSDSDGARALPLPQGAYYARMTQDAAQNLYTVVMPRSTPATLSVFKNDTLLETVVLSESIVAAAGGPELTDRANGSLNAAELGIMFPALYRGAFNWFYYPLALN